MRALRLSRDTFDRLCQLAVGEFPSTTYERYGDGWLVYIADATYSRLNARRFPKETDDELVLRVISTRN